MKATITLPDELERCQAHFQKSRQEAFASTKREGGAFFRPLLRYRQTSANLFSRSREHPQTGADPYRGLQSWPPPASGVRSGHSARPSGPPFGPLAATFAFLLPHPGALEIVWPLLCNFGDQRRRQHEAPDGSLRGVGESQNRVFQQPAKAYWSVQMVA